MGRLRWRALVYRIVYVAKQETDVQDVYIEHLRGTGTGSQLMRQAEDIARQRQCTGVWLDTFAFQALTFYQKLGYTIFGELKDHPRGISQYWLKKRFDEVL